MNEQRASSGSASASASGGGTTRTSTLLAGGASIAIGVLLAVWPDPTLLIFSQIAGWLMGVIGLVHAVELGSAGRLRSLAFVRSVLMGILGVVLIIWPGETLVVITVVIAIWLIFDGGSRVLNTMSAGSVRDEIVGNLLGVLEFFVGLAIAARPVGGVRASAVLVGVGLVVHGLARIWDGWKDPSTGVEASAPPEEAS